MKKLGWPTLFCHSLEVAPDGTITGYRLRQPDSKRRAAQSLRQLNFKIIGMGDSYNDINLLKESDTGILFRPPENVVREFPQFPVTRDYEELKPLIRTALEES
jgi:phosphoserine / homoserine phosphotransferase